MEHLRNDLDLPTQATKSATLRQLVLQAPAPVVADALGYSAKHMTRIWGAAGGSWTTYATRERGRDLPGVIGRNTDHFNTGTYQYQPPSFRRTVLPAHVA